MSDEYRTPDWLFRRLDRIFQFDLDAAATVDNRLVSNHLGPGGLGEDALAIHWAVTLAIAVGCGRGNIFVNPPYSQKAGPLHKWVFKMFEAWLDGCTVVAILPATPNTGWFHTFVKDKAYIWYPETRIQFNLPDGSPTKSARHDTMIAMWLPLRKGEEI